MKRNLNDGLAADLAALQSGATLRRTEYTPNDNGSVTRRITSASGAIESTEILTGALWELFAARHAQRTGGNVIAGKFGRAA